MDKEYIEFARLVYKMRKQQKKYFKTRNIDDLKESKRLEKEVDDITEKLLKEHIKSLQLSLFDEVFSF